MPLDLVKKAVMQWGGVIKDHWYENRGLRVRILCPNGHEYTTAGTTAKKHGCNDCKRKGERVLRAYLELNLGAPFPSKRPTWLQNHKTKLFELDLYCEEKSLAFEYQGPKHNLPAQQRRDEYKRKKCKEQNVRLIEVAYLERVFPLEIWVPTIKELFDKHNLKSIFGEIKIPTDPIFTGELKDLRQLAEEKGGSLLSSEYSGESALHEWGCSDLEHEPFEMSPSRVRKGHWCPSCARVAKWHEPQIKKFEREFGLKFESKIWRGARAPHYWSCPSGHWFLASTGSIRQQATRYGASCIFCNGRDSNHIFTGDAVAIVELRGGAFEVWELRKCKFQIFFLLC